MTDDLSEFLVRVPQPALRYGQGVILDWNVETFENAVEWQDKILRDLPVVASAEAFGFRPGDSVALLGWDANGRKGITSWCIWARIIEPGGTEEPVEPPELITAKKLSAEELHVGRIFVDGDPIETVLQSTITAQVPASDPDPPPTGSVKKKKTYNASWSQNYRSNNQQNTFNPQPHQGFWSNLNGNQRSLIGFPTSTIQSDLAAATEVLSVRVYLYFDHWYFNSGGTAVIGYHGHSSRPSTFSATTNQVQSSGWPKPGSRWVSLSTSGWANGSRAGISLGPGPSAHRRYYGRCRGHDQSNRPRLEITWREPA